MVRIETFEELVKIPFITHDIFINYNGLLFNGDKEINLEDFNNITNLNVKSVGVLQITAFHFFKLAPIYWKYLNAENKINDVSSPENLIITINSPVESKEFPGYYIIPYFSNYVISVDGVLIKKSTGELIKASKNNLGYYTFRMLCDDNTVQNRLRHRILCYAFKKYPPNVEDLDVNHINGVPGDDFLSNLEWATRSENMTHAYLNGLRNDNKPVQIRDIHQERTFILESCSAAGRMLSVTETTISNRAKTNGYKSFDGYQFRFHPCNDPWPELNSNSGKYVVEFPNGKTKRCTSTEAARLMGVAKVTLFRMLRENRSYSENGNKITRLVI